MNSNSNHGRPLHEFIHETIRAGGPTFEDVYAITRDSGRALAAIHAQGKVHGSIQPRTIFVAPDRAGTFGTKPADELGAVRSLEPRPSSSDPVLYMSPERRSGGPASFEDDVYALGLSLWEMFTGRPPVPGSNPRERPMAEQVLVDPRARIPADRLQRIFRALHDDPDQRPTAEEMGRGPTLFEWPEYSPITMKRDRLNPGPPRGKAEAEELDPSAQALLVLSAPGAEIIVGSLAPLQKPILTMGSGADQDIVLPHESIPGAHAVLRGRRPANQRLPRRTNRFSTTGAWRISAARAAPIQTGPGIARAGSC